MVLSVSEMPPAKSPFLGRRKETFAQNVVGDRFRYPSFSQGRSAINLELSAFNIQKKEKLVVFYAPGFLDDGGQTGQIRDPMLFWQNYYQGRIVEGL